jgi:hypothetical protein
MESEKNKSMKDFAVSVSDCEQIILGDYYYIDKSLFIKELLDNGTGSVTLITRPRRFGKTLNLSMLKCFFEKVALEKSKKDLFKNLKISQNKKCLLHQEKYPVIFLTFKEAKKPTWQKCYDHIKILISTEFNRHKYLLSSLDSYEEKNFNAILNGTANEALYENGLLKLSKYLFDYYKVKPIILIDEYDSPIQEGFIKKYYSEAVDFMRTFLGAGLKDNSSLEFSVITGITRVSKESIFSELNNLEVCSFLNKFYSDKFGLLQEEVDQLLKDYKLQQNAIEVKDWYNGYTSGNFTVYNPWSIINFAKQRELSTYWTYTSSNEIIKELIQTGSIDFKEVIEKLLLGEKIEREIIENIIFPDIKKRTSVLWSFLLYTGYLTYRNKFNKGGSPFAEFYIPNIEIKSCYETVIKSWIEEIAGDEQYLLMMNYLTKGDVENFSKKFSNFVVNSFSYFDATEKDSEIVYQMFILGLFASLEADYVIRSNKESGYGRADLMFIPKDKNKLGMVIELKKFDKKKDKDLEKTLERAIKQIEEKRYDQEFVSFGIKNILKLGMAFEGKEVLIKRG